MGNWLKVCCIKINVYTIPTDFSSWKRVLVITSDNKKTSSLGKCFRERKAVEIKG